MVFKITNERTMVEGQEPSAKPVDAGTSRKPAEMKSPAAQAVNLPGLLVNRAGESKSPYVCNSAQSLCLSPREVLSVHLCILWCT